MLGMRFKVNPAVLIAVIIFSILIFIYYLYLGSGL